MTGASGKSFRKCVRFSHPCSKQGHHPVLPAVCAEALNERVVTDVCHRAENAQRWWLQLWERAGIISSEVCYYPVNLQRGCEKAVILSLQVNPECEVAHLVGIESWIISAGMSDISADTATPNNRNNCSQLQIQRKTTCYILMSGV